MDIGELKGASRDVPDRRGTLWHNRAFVLLWSGQLVSTLGTQITSVSYVLLVLSMTGSATKAGVVAALTSAVALLLRLPAGLAADTRNRLAIVVCADLGRAAALASLPIAGLVGALTYRQVVIVAVLDAALGAFFQPAEAAALRHIIPGHQLREAAARNQSREYVATLLGPTVGGMLFSIQRAVPFLADALSYLVSAISLLLIRQPLNGPLRITAGDGRDTEPRWRTLTSGLRWVWHQRFVRSAVLWQAGITFVFPSIGLVTVVLARAQGAGSFEVGALFSLTNAGGLLGALAAPRLTARFEGRSLILTFGWVAALVTPLLCVSSSAYEIGLVGAAVFFLGPAANAAITGHVLVHAPQDLQGRASAAMSLVNGVALPLGPFSAGVLLGQLGPVTTVVVYSTFLLILAVVATAGAGGRVMVEGRAPDADGGTTGSADPDLCSGVRCPPMRGRRNIGEEGMIRMGLSAVAAPGAFTPKPPAPVPAGTGARPAGLSEQDQAAVIAARPAALHRAGQAAANLRSSDSAASGSGGSAPGQGSLDTYL